MTKKINPFELFAYSGPEYFCDREAELKELTAAFDSRRNIVLSAYRRLGKTSLIQHFHHHLSQRKQTMCIYVDVLATNSDQAFINKLISAIYAAIQEQESNLKHFLQAFGKMRPQVGVDPMTGMPTMSVQIDNEQQVTQSLDLAINRLIEQKGTVQIAIDEFQQISNYTGGTHIDASLRALFPRSENIHFLFSGSEQHLLEALFSDHSRPMFASAQMMKLDKIAVEPYRNFIRKQLQRQKIRITDAVIEEILERTERHTFYTQFVCNNLYDRAVGEVTATDVRTTIQACVQQFETTYYYYQKMLSSNQWKLLKAIAQYDTVSNVYGKTFLNRHQFSASSVRQSLDTLIDHQLVHEIIGPEGSQYKIYDVFLKLWLSSLG